MADRKLLKDAVNLAAPHTWAASVMPCVLASALSYREQGFLKADLTVCLFLIAVLMQSSVNALNDYADFVKGTDTAENSPDPTDAVIVYGLKPKTARNLGIGYLAAAFILGIYTVWRCGFVLLVIGLIGALVIVAYSGGKTPISYLPLGELISGFVMGGLITLAGVYMQTGALRFSVLAEALPLMIGIGMIMFSNNGCDIERDLAAGRRTLPCLLGRERTDRWYRILLAIWLVCPVAVFAVQGRWMAALVYALESLVFLSHFVRQMHTPLGEERRGQIMAGATNLVILTGFAYSLAILVE
jgi:1,4-dihydroxy-2-naphthoate octaprenyltransferase